MNKSEQLIACLEGEIAKRDARIVELESQYQRDVYGLNNECDPIGGDPAGGYANDNARLRAELSVLKAQEPVEYQLRALIRDVTNIPEAGYYMPQSWHDQVIALSLSGKLDAPVSEDKAQGVVQWPNADEIMQMAFEEGQPADDASGYCFELEEFDLFIERLMSEVARLNAAPAQHPKCKTCDDNGMIGGPSFYAPDDGGEPCPDCCSPVQQVSVPGGWRVERGYSPSGYVLHSPSGSMVRVCDSGGGGIETAFALFLKAMLAAAPAAPAAYAGLVEVLAELVSAANSVNKGREHEVRGLQDSEPCYWQRKEWVDWLVTLGEQGRSALAAHRAKGVV